MALDADLPPGTPAGWYWLPSRPNERAYWDGGAWTATADVDSGRDGTSHPGLYEGLGGEPVPCPVCGGTVSTFASKCPHCNHSLGPSLAAAKVGALGCGMFLAIVVGFTLVAWGIWALVDLVV